MIITELDGIVVSRERWAFGIEDFSLKKIGPAQYSLSVGDVEVALMEYIDTNGQYNIQYTENECLIFGYDGKVLERKSHPQRLPLGFALRLDARKGGVLIIKIVNLIQMLTELTKRSDRC